MSSISDNPRFGHAADAAECAVSVVFPVYNESGNLRDLYAECCQTLDAMAVDYELVFVDDGSNDGSIELLRELAAQDERVRVLLFRRNFGQTAAMAAGLDYARGAVIITMDADRQNDPADIPRMIEKLEEGFDLVCGWRYDRKDGFLLRLLPSMMANWIISVATDVKLHDYGCTLKVFRRSVAKNIDLYGEMHRFIPAIASWMGVSIAELKVNHRARTAGESKYGLSRTIRVVLDLITVKYLLSYSSRPLQLFGLVGLVSAGLGFFIGTIMTVQRLFFAIPLSDRPLLLLAIMLVFMGLQFITIGLLAEVQTRAYHESQRKSTYVIREILNDKPSDGKAGGAGESASSEIKHSPFVNESTGTLA